MRKIILTTLLISSFCFGLELSQIEPTMKKDLKKSMEIMNDKSLNNKMKASNMFKLFDSYFDYNLMSKLALSKYYEGLTDAQKIEFTNLFISKLKTSFTDKLSLYSGQNIVVEGVTRPNPSRLFLNSKISTKDKNYTITFKFYRANGDDFLIYDIDILGVSIIQTYRTQFNDLSSRVSFDEIIKRLEATNLPDKKSTK